MHHTTALQVVPCPLSVSEVSEPYIPEAVASPCASFTITDLLEQIVCQVVPAPLPAHAKKPRGAPQKVSWRQLWLGLLYCVLGGMHSYQDFWRTLMMKAVGPFAPLEQITDDALVLRCEQAGVEPLQQMLAALSERLAQPLASAAAKVGTPVAAFATSIVAVDESTLDAVCRHLEHLRPLRAGDPALLAGKLAGRFNIRTQQWDF